MKTAIRFLWPYWSRYKGRALLIVSLGAVCAGAQVVMPLVMRHLIDGLKTGSTLDLIIRDAMIILAAGFSLAGANLVAVRNRARMNMILEWEIRQAVFERIVRLDLAFYRRYETGDIVTRLVDDVQEKLSWFACSGIFRAAQSSLLFLMALAAMLYLKPFLAMWALAPLPFLLLLFIRLRKLVTERYSRVQKTISAIFSFLDATFSGIRVVKANLKEACQDSVFAAKAQEQMEAEIAAAKAQAAIGSFFHYAGYMAVLLVFLVGGLQVMAGRITIGDLVAFQFFASMLVWPVFDLGNFLVAGRRAGVCIGRLEELMDTTTTVVEPASPRAIPVPVGPERPADAIPGDGRKRNVPAGTQLEVSGVSYRAAPEGPDLLEEISFAARPGERVALVGKLGSGKSLLMSLIPRLVDVTGGRVLFGDADIRDLGLAEWRSLIGYAPQEPVIFSGTVRENVSLGRPEVSDEDVSAALKAAQMAGELKSFPKGIETMVGPRGLTLSGGQKQRVAVARAIVAKPRVLLLDDCTSAMDADTEDRLWEALKTYLPGSLHVVITHRPKTIASADLILTLDNGVVAESGTHEALIRRDGLYKEIYQRVKLEDELRKEK